VHHTQCGTGFLADPGFRSQAAAATGLAEAALEAAAVADPDVTVRADVARLLASPLLSPKVSVSGHVYDIATGRVTTAVDALFPLPADGGRRRLWRLPDDGPRRLSRLPGDACHGASAGSGAGRGADLSVRP
jgi:hypothetical protein